MPKGGARPGAGRKAGPERTTKGIRLSPAAWGRLAELADKAGTTQSEILESLILPPEPR